MICELVNDGLGVALGLRMGDELILTEWYPDATTARARAEALRVRLLSRGWLQRQ